jgi:hypothetical protein
MKPLKQILRLRLSKHKSTLIDATLALGILVSGALTYRSCAQLSPQDRPASKASQTSASHAEDTVRIRVRISPIIDSVNCDTLWIISSETDTVWKTVEITLPTIHFPAAVASQPADTLNTNEKE